MDEIPWQEGRWWRVIDPDGELWCETSREPEARAAVRPGDRLQRRWVATLEEWRDVEEMSGKT
jgi:hypothetical protein